MNSEVPSKSDLQNRLAALQRFDRAARINCLLLALTIGLVVGALFWFATQLLIWTTPAPAGPHLALVSVLLPGYSVTPQGAVLGFLWAFVGASLCAALIYAGYLRLLRKRLLSRVFDADASDAEFRVRPILLLAKAEFSLILALLAGAQLVITSAYLMGIGGAEVLEHIRLLQYYLPGYDSSVFGVLVGAIELALIVYLGSWFFSSVYNRLASSTIEQRAKRSAASRVAQHNPLSPEERARKHVVILGAGPAGLATGTELAAAGVKVTVLERNGYVGGLCRTVREDGYSFDLGGHRWFTKNEQLNDWFRRLMGDEVVMVERISRIYHSGKYYQYPIEIGDVIRNAGPVTIIKAGVTFLASTVRHLLFPTEVKNMKQAYTAQFGSELYEMFFRRYTEKVWGKPCEELSSDWVSQRSKGLSIWTILQESLSNRQSQLKSLIEEFMYPRDGYVRVPERMAEEIERHGNQIMTGTNVTQIVHHGVNNIEVKFEEGGKERSIIATEIVSTIPLGVLARISLPAAPESVVKAAGALKFRDLVTVNLKLQCDQVSIDTWLYVQDEDILFGRLHEPKNWSPAMVPDSDHTSLVLECFCTRGDSTWEMSDDEVAQRCVSDLADKLGFVDANDVVGWTIIRTAQCYPVYDMDYYENTALVKDYIAGFDGVNIVGRGGTFRYNNADHSIEMGLLLGQKILGYDVDPLEVNTEPEYQEIVRNEDELQRDRYEALPTASVRA